MRRANLRTSLTAWALEFAAAGAVGVFLGLVGPFGSYFNGPVWERVLYWVGTLCVGIGVYGVAVRLLLERDLPRSQSWAALAVLVALISVPFAGGVALVVSALWPEVTFLRPWDWYLETVVISTPLVLCQALLLHRRRRRRLAAEMRSAGAPQSGAPSVPLGDVLCLQMEDHYVRVHTSGGSRLVLTTLGQAVSALDGVEGLQVHRSWWVARQAVARSVVDGRNLRLQLTNGMIAPVARSAVATIRAVGWITADG